MERSCLGDSCLVKCDEETTRQRQKEIKQRGEEEEGRYGVNNNKKADEPKKTDGMGGEKYRNVVQTDTDMDRHAQFKRTDDVNASKYKDNSGVNTKENAYSS